MSAKHVLNGAELRQRGYRWSQVSADSDDLFGLSYLYRLKLTDKTFEVLGAAAVINIAGRMKTSRRKLMLKFGIGDPNLENVLKKFQTSARDSQSKAVNLLIGFFSSNRHTYRDLFSPLLFSEGRIFNLGIQARVSLTLGRQTVPSAVLNATVDAVAGAWGNFWNCNSRWIGWLPRTRCWTAGSGCDTGRCQCVDFDDQAKPVCLGWRPCWCI